MRGVVVASCCLVAAVRAVKRNEEGINHEPTGVPYQDPDDPVWKSEIADEGALRTRVRTARSGWRWRQ